jgi:glycosyltransferase involved in cell wall biosynthesis
MIKLLIITPNLNLPGGVCKFIKLLSKELNEKKFQIEYLYVGKTNNSFKNFFYPLLILNQKHRLKKILNTFQPDIVHINPSLAYTAIIRDFLFLKTIKKKGYPVLFFIHGWQEKISNKFNNFIGKHYFKKRFVMADVIVVLAHQFENKLLSLGLNPNKILVTSTMVESSQYLQLNKKFSQPYNILFCGAMKKSKGPFELLNAIPLVIEQYPNTFFNFVGNGKDLKKLKRKIKKMKIEKNVNFTGFKTGNELIELFQQAHIFVFPSHSEGFPTVVLEAMAAGNVLIYTPVGGLVNALVEYKNGLMIKSLPPNPKEIADHIVQLINNPEIMIRISQNNISDIKEKYDIKIITKTIENIYQDILKKPNLGS